MPSPTISHLICTTALVVLIFILPLFYNIAVDHVRVDMICRELREIADYVSNTIANLYFLVNSTYVFDVSLQKELVYLPSNIENFIYVLKIGVKDGYASNVTAYLKERPSVEVVAWLIPGLKVDSGKSFVESCGRTVIVGCYRNNSGVFVWIGYG
ncbi:hypothetical protein KEJ32_04770 [Candidatus Bathyarchaeota archaeon]|nr:hypothetical protein [Candidatus Bathyarchaeota archaeon]